MSTKAPLRMSKSLTYKKPSKALTKHATESSIPQTQIDEKQPDLSFLIKNLMKNNENVSGDNSIFKIFLSTLKMQQRLYNRCCLLYSK